MKEGMILKTAEAPSGGAGASSEDMEKINRYTRREFGPEEVYVFSLALCDNEVDRDFERFDAQGLEKLRELFLGKTCIFDHERKSANQTARIFDTWLERNQGRRTKAGEEYVRLAAKAYLPRSEDTKLVIERIESGILKEVSVSCSVSSTVCGICGKERCSHVKGREYDGSLCHRILREPTDAYECSFVAVPAQRGAGVIKSFWRGETEMDLEKALEEAAESGVTISKEQARVLSEELRELREKAEWGEKYRESLSANVLRCSRMVQPELPAEVMKSAMKGLSFGELCELERAFAQAAGKRLPLQPQLAAKNEERAKASGGNREFCI